jgi:hypothetical protein
MDATTLEPIESPTEPAPETQTGAAVSKSEKGATSCTWWLADDGGWIKLVIWPHAAGLFMAAALGRL